MKKNLFFAYSIFLFCFTLISYAFVDGNIPYLRVLYSGFHTQNREVTAFVYAILLVTFFIFYFLFIRLYIKKKLFLRDVIVLIGMTVVILLFSYPAILSSDIFNYIVTAKVLFYYHENPYVIMPIEFIGEPYVVFTRAANKIALYGSAWLFISLFPYFLGFGNFIATLFGFKLIASFFYVGTGIVMYKLTKNVFQMLLFILNPLVIIEILISGHNDIVMVFFVLLSYYLLQKKRFFWAIIAFLFSIGIKYVSIVLLPIFVYILVRTIQKEKINWHKIFSLSGWAMIGVFLLSPVREEFYPWYVVWFLSFAVLIPKKNLLLLVSQVLTFTTLLRYIPVLYTGMYGGIVPIAKEIVTFVPLLIIICFVFFRKGIKKYES